MEKIRTLGTRFFKYVQYRLWLICVWIRENKKTFIRSVIVAAVAASAIFWFFLRTYHDYEVIDEVERQSDTSANYYFSDEGILCYSKDGASFTNNKGETVWNQVFGMESPKMHCCGAYAAIGDIGANSVYIFNQEGTEGRLTLDKPIQDLRISKQGVAAVVLTDESANQINLYNKDGKILASIKATISNSGYPLALALSEDGTRLVVSYILFNGGKINSQLVFYNFSNMDNSSEPAGIYEFEELFPKIEFIDETNVIACGENGFYTYRFKDTVIEQHSQTYGSEVKSVFLTEKHIGVVTKNTENISEGEAADKYKVSIYNYSGSKAGGFTFDFEYKSIEASDKELVFCSDLECEIYSYRGHKKFQYTFEHVIENVLPANKSGQYFLLDAQSVQTIILK